MFTLFLNACSIVCFGYSIRNFLAITDSSKCLVIFYPISTNSHREGTVHVCFNNNKLKKI